MKISEIIKDLEKLKDKYGDKNVLLDQGLGHWINPIDTKAREIHVSQDIDDGLCYQVYRGDYIELMFRT